MNRKLLLVHLGAEKQSDFELLLPKVKERILNECAIHIGPQRILITNEVCYPLAEIMREKLTTWFKHKIEVPKKEPTHLPINYSLRDITWLIERNSTRDNLVVVITHIEPKNILNSLAIKTPTNFALNYISLSDLDKSYVLISPKFEALIEQ